MRETARTREYRDDPVIARLIQLNQGSATNIYTFDIARAAEEISTFGLRAFGPQLWSVRIKPIATFSFATGVTEESETRTQATRTDSESLDWSQTSEGQMRQHIASVRAGSQLVYRERLAKRLESLLAIAEDEEEAWAACSPESMRRLLLFLESLPHLGYPAITVTPSRTFRAEWTVNHEKHFAVDFLPDGNVRFVVFSPNPRHPDRPRRISGVTSWEDVLVAMERYKVSQWANRART